MQKMAVSLENRPENTWHRKHNTCISDVRQRGPLLALPQECGSMAATRAGPRLTSVVDHLLVGVRSVDFRAKNRRPTSDHSIEVFAYGGPSLRMIPARPSIDQNLL